MLVTETEWRKAKQAYTLTIAEVKWSRYNRDAMESVHRVLGGWGEFGAFGSIHHFPMEQVEQYELRTLGLIALLEQERHPYTTEAREYLERKGHRWGGLRAAYVDYHDKTVPTLIEGMYHQWKDKQEGAK